MSEAQLPPNWSEARLSALVADVSYGYTAKAVDEPVGPRMLRITDIQDDRVNWLTVPYCRISDVDLPKYKLERGDLLFARTGATVGKSFMIRRDVPTSVYASYLVRVRCRDHELSRYLSHFFRSPMYWSQIMEFSSGVAQPSVNGSKLKLLRIPVAPRAERKRIADKLDSLQMRLDACRERLDRVPEILKRFRQSVLAAAVSGRLTQQWRAGKPFPVRAEELLSELRHRHDDHGTFRRGNAAAPVEEAHDFDESMLPSGWVVARLAELCEPGRPITYGILKPGPDLPSGVPYVRVADFPNNKLNLTTIRYTSDAIDSQFARSRLRTGDLLISIRGTVGRLCFVPKQLEGANITQDSARLSIDDQVNPFYVSAVLQSDDARRRMARATKGVAVRGINIGDLRVLQIPLPTRDEQDEIMRRVQRLFSTADQLEPRLAASRSRVERLTESVLAKAFRGELVSQRRAAVPADGMVARMDSGRPYETARSCGQEVARPSGRRKRA